MSSSQNPHDHFAIQKILADYCFALDSKDFEGLSEVFTEDIDAKYPFPGGEVQGIEAISEAIQGR
jgi:hypothetical protein